MIDVGMDLSRSSSPTSPAQSRSARADSPGLCPVGFWISLSMETRQHLWASCLATLTIKKGALCLNGIFCISVHAHCLLSCHWARLRRVWLPFYSPSNDIYLYRLTKYPPEPSLSRLSNPRSLRCSSPLIIFVAFCCICSNMSISIVYCGAQHWIQNPKCVSLSLSRGEGSPSLTCWQHCLKQPRRLFTCFTAWVRCWLVVNMLSTRTSCINSHQEKNGEATTCNRH